MPNAAFKLMNKSTHQIVHVKKVHLCKNDKLGLKRDYTLYLINLTQPAIKPPGISEILADK